MSEQINEPTRDNSHHHQSSFLIRISVILGALCMFAPVGTDMYLAGIVNIANDFSVDVSKSQMTLSVYFLGLAFGQILYGPLIDRYGRKLPLVIGEVVFILCSVLIVVAGNIESIIVLRLLQAIGGCSGMIVGRAMVRDLFNMHQSARVYAMLGVVQGLAPILAPIAGGFILAHWGWRSAFVVMAVFGLICLGATVAGLPETLPQPVRRNVNIRQTMRDYWQMLWFRPFIIPALSGSVAGSFLFAYICASPDVFITIFGVSQTTYTLIFALNMAGTIVAAQMNHFFAKKHSPEFLLKVTLIFTAVCCAVLVIISGRASLIQFMIPLWFSIATIPLIFANSVAIAMDRCGQMAGIASGLFGVLQFGAASIAGMAVSAWRSQTPAPMAWIMLIAVALGLAILLAGSKREAHTVDEKAE